MPPGLLGTRFQAPGINALTSTRWAWGARNQSEGVSLVRPSQTTEQGTCKTVLGRALPTFDSFLCARC